MAKGLSSSSKKCSEVGCDFRHPVELEAPKRAPRRGAMFIEYVVRCERAPQRGAMSWIR
jgi:hypothetical protein